MKSAVVFGLIVMGFVLLILSSLWASLFPATSTWTEEKSLRSTEVKTRLSNIGPIVNGTAQSMHRGPDPATLKAEFDALVKENQQLDAEFESATIRPQTASRMLKWSGIALAAVGLIGWYALKNVGS
jgi:hypothetical protein